MLLQYLCISSKFFFCINANNMKSYGCRRGMTKFWVIFKAIITAQMLTALSLPFLFL
jgi:hypothetical protein